MVFLPFRDLYVKSTRTPFYVTSTSSLHAFLRDLYVKSTRLFTLPLHELYARALATPTLREVYAGAKI